MIIFENIKINDTSYGGYGVGKLPDGKTVFVPFSVDGDIVDVEVYEDKKNYCYGRIADLKTPSIKRVKENYCCLIGICGGCPFGHIQYSEQIEIKHRILKNAFRQIDDFAINETIIGEPLRYRIRCSFKISEGNIGFYKYNSRDFVRIDDCPVISKNIVDYARKFKYPSDIREILFTENNNGEIVSGLDKKISFYETEYGKVPIWGDSFFQGNKFLIPKLLNIGEEFSKNSGRVLELYCGSGFFTTVLSKNSEFVLAMDFDKDAIKIARKMGIKSSVFKVQDLNRPFDVTGEFDTVFVDPSRNGLSKNVIKVIQTLQPDRIIYVSCNPNTMARDIGCFYENYEISKFYMIDMFPGTYHIESAALLKKRN